MSQRTLEAFLFDEKHLSQIPAIQQLMTLGYEYLSPQQALALRGGKTSNVFLDRVLVEQLKKINRIHHKGAEHLFSEANIQSAVQKIKNVQYDGLQKTSAALYDTMTLGVALEQRVGGAQKSFTLNYIDWSEPARNVFHVVPEFAVARQRSVETVRPDLVLFVNGIPLAVIKCKAPHVAVEQGVSQMIRNWGDDYSPRLFTSAQLVMAVNKNAARYATAGTAAKFWGEWQELEDRESAVENSINRPLSDAQKDALFSAPFTAVRAQFQQLESHGPRQVTAQDRAIYSLCRPQRLLELSGRFTLFDAGVKKIARYPQFFAVRATIERIKQRGEDGKRAGGVIWHTQGSGKSLTMVMLARALVLEETLVNPRLILVTDRDDLDKQLGGTFVACGLSKERATSGRDLVTHLKNKVGVVTTLIHKFETGWENEKYVDDSADIFVLVDESHRTNFGSFAAKMRTILPNACYLGFTGTPLLKKNKNNFSKFGKPIEPNYPIRQAVRDKAVVPLLYEGRHVEMEQNQKAIDLWFDRHTTGLSKEQCADLKSKYARAEQLNKADQVVYMRAFDISEHYRATWQGTGFKAQLVAPDKETALKYHGYLSDIGYVTSEVVISSPDSREGHEDKPTPAVHEFWARMMKRFQSESEYNKQIIEQFKDSAEEPEILIVVDKLLTGFDAPRNTVLYLCRTLREHTLLQAIARVNRLHEGKDHGYIIDYANILGELDKALSLYDAFAGYDDADLSEMLLPVRQEVDRLPQCYSDLWDIFQSIENKHDAEAFEVLLADDDLREEFYDRLIDYSKALGIALSTEHFIKTTEDDKLGRYKDDLKQFQKLKQSVKLRYAEAIDYRDYAPKIKKLLDSHIQANEVTQINAPVNIFDDQTFSELKQGYGIYAEQSPAAKADSIAHATKKAITEKMEQDPAFYEKFSKLIQQAIDDFRAKRLSDLDYLNKVSDIREATVSKQRDDVPDGLLGNDEACAYYGVIRPTLIEGGRSTEEIDDLSARVALAVQDILKKHKKVDFWRDETAQKDAMNDIDDFLCDRLDLELSSEQINDIIAKTLQIARNRQES